jgi:hypothetical protein
MMDGFVGRTVIEVSVIVITLVKNTRNRTTYDMINNDGTIARKQYYLFIKRKGLSHNEFYYDK